MIYILTTGIVAGVIVFACILYAISMRRNMVAVTGVLESTVRTNQELQTRAEAALRDVAALHEILRGIVNRPLAIIAPDDQMDRLVAKALERLTPEKVPMN